MRDADSDLDDHMALFDKVGIFIAQPFDFVFHRGRVSRRIMGLGAYCDNY